jgi:hypothetical protein
VSLITPAEATAAHDFGLVGAALQGAIDREEAWLARRIGPLAGERTEAFALAGFGYPGQHEVRLRRPTDEDGLRQVLDAGADVTASVMLLRNGWSVAHMTPIASYPISFYGPVAVTYTPNDELEVRRVLLGLLALSADPAGPYSMEMMGSYSYQKAGGSVTRARASLVRSLGAPPEAGAVTVRSTVRHGVLGAFGR